MYCDILKPTRVESQQKTDCSCQKAYILRTRCFKASDSIHKYMHPQSTYCSVCFALLSFAVFYRILFAVLISVKVTGM